ncbi:MAG: autotransporter assembly complex protein TamA [Caulobacterales bacterium]
MVQMRVHGPFSVSLGARWAASAAALAAACAPAAHAAEASPVIIDGVDDEATRQAMRAALVERPPPTTAFDADRLADEAALRLRDWLRSEGYYAGAVEPVPSPDAAPRARVTATLGKRFTFAAPDLNLDDVAETDVPFARAALTRIVTTGRPARAADVLAGEEAVLATLRARGYANAAIGPREAVVDHATGQMRLTIQVRSGGAQVRLGGVQVEPQGAVNDAFLKTLPTWRRGATYTPEALTSLRRAFTSTGAFARVETALGDAAPGAEANAPRDVIVRVERAKPRTIDLGASWSSTEGAGLDALWEYRNALHRAETTSLALRLADREQRATAGLFLPHAAGLGRARRFTVSAVREEARPYDRVGVSLSTAVEAQRTVRDALTYGASLAYDAYDATSGIDNALVLSGFGSWRRNGADDRFDPRRGETFELRVEPAVSTGSATTAFVRALADARIYATPQTATDTDGRFTYAARLRAGWVQPLAGAARDLPLDRRFYAGGGGSVRGYAFQSIYPTNVAASAEPPGGQGLFETSLEARARFASHWGAAAFVDGGSAFDDAEGLADLRWGAGLGLRYDLGFGPLRIDVAAPLDRRPRDREVAVYVSFGQAF